MNQLTTSLNLTQHDDVYAQIVALFEELPEEESLKATAKLVLLLANHIGDAQVIAEAVAIVRNSTRSKEGDAHVAS